GLAHGVADGAVAGAAAEVAAELIGDLGGLAEIVAVEGLDHGDGEAGGAVAALGPVVVDHGLLHGVERAARVGDALDGDDLAAGDHGQQRDARVDGAEPALAVAVRLHERDGAGAAVALGAALLAAGLADRAEVVEQRPVGRLAFDADGLAVERE